MATPASDNRLHSVIEAVKASGTSKARVAVSQVACMMDFGPMPWPTGN